MKPTQIKLVIDSVDLSALILRLHGFVSGNLNRFTSTSRARSFPLNYLASWWIASAINEYSLCALTVAEFMEEIETRCSIESVLADAFAEIDGF